MCTDLISEKGFNFRIKSFSAQHNYSVSNVFLPCYFFKELIQLSGIVSPDPFQHDRLIARLLMTIARTAIASHFTPLFFEWNLFSFVFLSTENVIVEMHFNFFIYFLWNNSIFAFDWSLWWGLIEIIYNGGILLFCLIFC